MLLLLRTRRFFPTIFSSSSLWTQRSAGVAGLVRGFERGSHERNKKNQSRFLLALSGHMAILLGLHKSPVFAEENPIANNDEETGYITGLRKVEDGSIVSNTHTSKWRIFTDNGRELFSKGKLDEAEKYFQLALDEAKRGFGGRDPHVASSCNNLAELYRVRKAYEKAEPLYLEAITILEESLGADDIRVGAALHNLGQFYLARRKLEQARECYERSLKIKGRILGYGHTDYANTMYHLGTVLNLQGKEKDAEVLVWESIRILEEAGQGETITCIRRMKYLSQMLLKANKVAEAENLQRKILHILEISKGWDSMDTIIAAEDLALTLQSLGRLSEARELLQRCLEIRKRVLPEDHIQVAANMLHLARIAMLDASHQRKLKFSLDQFELEQAKYLLGNAVRIAKKQLERLRMNPTNPPDSRTATEIGNGATTTLLILLQSLDAVGLMVVQKLDSGQSKDKVALLGELEVALCECVNIMKEPGLRNLVLTSPTIKTEYSSCLKHLISILNEYVNDVAQKSEALHQLKREAQQIETDFLTSRR